MINAKGGIWSLNTVLLFYPTIDNWKQTEKLNPTGLCNIVEVSMHYDAYGIHQTSIAEPIHCEYNILHIEMTNDNKHTYTIHKNSKQMFNTQILEDLNSYLETNNLPNINDCCFAPDITFEGDVLENDKDGNHSNENNLKEIKNGGLGKVMDGFFTMRSIEENSVCISEKICDYLSGLRP